jgi:hypothetical protein
VALYGGQNSREYGKTDKQPFSPDLPPKKRNNFISGYIGLIEEVACNCRSARAHNTGRFLGLPRYYNL